MILNNKKMAVYFLAIFFVLADRFLKMLAVAGFFNTPLRAIVDWFSFYFQPNYYIAFSLPVTGVWLSYFIFVIIIVLLYFFVSSIKEKRNFEAAGLFFIISGAASNLFDRFKYGYVIDYFDVKFFTVFNLADAMIVSGVIILLYYYLFLEKKINKI